MEGGCYQSTLGEFPSLGGHKMQQIPHAYSRPEPAQPELSTITTTLGELIEAIDEEVEPEEDLSLKGYKLADKDRV